MPSAVLCTAALYCSLMTGSVDLIVFLHETTSNSSLLERQHSAMKYSMVWCMRFCTRGRLTCLKGKTSLEYYEKVNLIPVYHKLMKTFLANALALSTILCWLKNFTSSSRIHLLAAVPVNHGHCSPTKNCSQW